MLIRGYKRRKIKEAPSILIDLLKVIHITCLKKTKIYELIKLGEFKPIKLGRKTVFLESEIFAWINKKIAERDNS